MTQSRTELNKTVSGRIDMLSGITALQNVSANIVASKPSRISDLIPQELGLWQRKRIVQTLHGRLASVDSSVGG